jgi:hypothetical protein
MWRPDEPISCLHARREQDAQKTTNGAVPPAPAARVHERVLTTATAFVTKVTLPSSSFSFARAAYLVGGRAPARRHKKQQQGRGGAAPNLFATRAAATAVCHRQPFFFFFFFFFLLLLLLLLALPAAVLLARLGDVGDRGVLLPAGGAGPVAAGAQLLPEG